MKTSIALIILFVLSSCGKQETYENWNTDRRQNKGIFVPLLISKRYKDPPRMNWADTTWVPDKVVYYFPPLTDTASHSGVPNDTVDHKCPFDVDQSLRIEVRVYTVYEIKPQ